MISLLKQKSICPSISASCSLVCLSICAYMCLHLSASMSIHLFVYTSPLTCSHIDPPTWIHVCLVPTCIFQYTCLPICLNSHSPICLHVSISMREVVTHFSYRMVQWSHMLINFPRQWLYPSLHRQLNPLGKQMMRKRTLSSQFRLQWTRSHLYQSHPHYKHCLTRYVMAF